MMLNLLRLPNFWAIGLAVIVGGLVVTGIFRAGVKHERNKQVAETAETNKSIVEDRGKDEAEISAEAAANAKIDAEVQKQLKLKANERFILDEETAALLASVK